MSTKRFIFGATLGLVILGSGMAIASHVQMPKAPAPALEAKAGFSDAEEAAIVHIVEKTLHDKPEIILESIKSMQMREQQKAIHSVEQKLSAHKKALQAIGHSPVMGNPNGSVTMLEFLDYQCGHCKQMGPIVKSLIKSNDSLKVVIKEYPIFGSISAYAAKAVIASAQQGHEKMGALHTALLKSKHRLNKEVVDKLAGKVGLNTDQLKQAIKSKAVQEEVHKTAILARNIGIMGTPAFILMNKDASKILFIPGGTSVSNLQKAISQLESRDLPTQH